MTFIPSTLIVYTGCI